ncbi:hypothetical protein B0H13DRAFT_2676471 [Mycena leptocephala]|nr:hypothetical protein B0H13DRAFT_2676471 [Mycena leptocephala]
MDVETPTLQRSEDLWFDDGTVVLKAQTTLFRVYRGILAAQSPIFRDTFAIPQPVAQEMYDGLPIILLPDSPADLKIFLAATHDPGYFKTSPVGGMDVLCSLLRLSTKYCVDHLRNDMLSTLTALYPSSLDAWLGRCPPVGYIMANGDAFKALGLALELQILPILPGVLFECSANTPRAIFNADIQDGNKETCLSVREDFATEYCPRIYRSLLMARSGEPLICGNALGCDSTRLECFGSNIISVTIDEIFTKELDWDNLPLCENCTAAAQAEFRLGRLALWNNLPRIFDLPPWDQLLQAH